MTCYCLIKVTVRDRNSSLLSLVAHYNRIYYNEMSSSASGFAESISGRSTSLASRGTQAEYLTLLSAHNVYFADLPTTRRLQHEEGLGGFGVTTDDEMAGWVDSLYAPNLASHLLGSGITIAD